MHPVLYMIMVAFIIITSIASGRFTTAFWGFIVIVAIRLGLRVWAAHYMCSDHSSDSIKDSPEWNAPEYQEWLKNKN